MAAVAAAGKGNGKSPPPPPKSVTKPPPSAASGFQSKVCDGELNKGVSTVVTSLDGTKRRQHADGSTEVVKSVRPADKPHHGRLADPSWPEPALAAHCESAARPGYREGAAHEFLDDEQVLKAKVKLFADLVKKSKKMVVYAGAGLSTSSGIPDYATRTGAAGVLQQQQGKGKGKAGKGVGASSNPNTFYNARPNFGHRTLAALATKGLLWRLVQQNHDGLPQKAGVPQRLMNEIHGAIYDPSNPVVPMTGSVRSDLFKDLLVCERQADLVLTLGSSLAGMNADRLVLTCSERSLRSSNPVVHGSVIVSLQTTPHDASAAVRIYATIDRTMELLAEELALDVPDEMPLDLPLSLPSHCRPAGPDVDVFRVPYDADGNRVEEGSELAQTWDLSHRSIHTVTEGPQKGCRAIILGKTDDGHFRVGIRLFAESTADWHDIRIMGSWWVTAAIQGDVDKLPLANREEAPAED